MQKKTNVPLPSKTPHGSTSNASSRKTACCYNYCHMCLLFIGNKVNIKRVPSSSKGDRTNTSYESGEQPLTDLFFFSFFLLVLRRQSELRLTKSCAGIFSPLPVKVTLPKLTVKNLNETCMSVHFVLPFGSIPAGKKYRQKENYILPPTSAVHERHGPVSGIQGCFFFYHYFIFSFKTAERSILSFRCPKVCKIELKEAQCFKGEITKTIVIHKIMPDF